MTAVQRHEDTTYVQQGDGPPIVLIHGMGLNRAMWQWQLPDLIEHFTVITYDLLGHGDSARLDGACTLTTLSEQLFRLLDHLHLSNLSIVGFSLGGMIARRFTIDHPEYVKALAILHSPHDRTDDERAHLLHRLSLVQDNPPATTAPAALERWFSPGFRQHNPSMMQLISDWMGANRKDDYARVYEVLAKGDTELADAITSIPCPTLLVSADEDIGNSPAMAMKMAECITQSQVVIHKGLRHMALAEDPESFNPPLIDFLRANT